MKTTLDLLGDLVREIKLRTLHEGNKLKTPSPNCRAKYCEIARRRTAPGPAG